MKYTHSMENEGKPKAGGQAWAERFLRDRVGTGRQKRGLPAVIEETGVGDAMAAHIPDEDAAAITLVNAQLSLSGLRPPPLNWEDVAELARQAHLRDAERQRAEKAAQQAEEGAIEDSYRAYIEDERGRIAGILGATLDEITDTALNYLMQCDGENDIRACWQVNWWHGDSPDDDRRLTDEDYAQEMADLDKEQERAAQQEAKLRLPAHLHHLLHDGETWWTLERNAAAAGFLDVKQYLEWRAGDASH